MYPAFGIKGARLFLGLRSFRCSLYLLKQDAVRVASTAKYRDLFTKAEQAV
jgi:hypothetical protein